METFALLMETVALALLMETTAFALQAQVGDYSWI